MINYKKQGKRNKVNGAIFEKRVRIDLEESGWVVSKWQNNVDLKQSKLIPARHQYNAWNKSFSLGSGFPDFIAYKNLYGKNIITGIEVKTNGILDRHEKIKIKWLLDNNIFTDILIAVKTKVKNKIVVEYRNVKEYLKC